MKKLIITLLLGSFVFAGVTFNKSVGYADTDGTVTVSDGFGVDFALNNGMSFGWDTNSGMMIKAGNLPANVGLRIGIKNDNAAITNTIGLGYDWWTSSGDGISTAVGTYVDYAKSSAAESTTLRLNVSWGF